MLRFDYIIAIENKQYLKPDKILPIAGSAILGIPLGIIILSNLNMYVLKIIISIIILIARNLYSTKFQEPGETMKVVYYFGY